MIDITNLPVIKSLDLEDIFLLDSIDNVYREKHFDVYKYDGVGVPRVSHILKECIGKEYLMLWAAKLGQRQMIIERNKATTIGSRVHEMIEHYLLTGNDLDLSYKTSPVYMNEINRAYENFKDWIIYIESLGYKIEEVIATETPVICPWYGGTIDCIVKINGKIYIIDFKTSKQISYEYITQTCSYMWAVNNGYAPHLPYIDGVGIIRIDKEKRKFEDLFLNNHIPYQADIINHFYNGFGSLLSCFYSNINMKNLFANYKKEYDIKETI